MFRLEEDPDHKETLQSLCLQALHDSIPSIRLAAVIELCHREYKEPLIQNISAMVDTSEYIHASRSFPKELITPMRLGRMMLRFNHLDVHARIIVLKHLFTWLHDLSERLSAKEAELLMTLLDSALRQHGSATTWILALRCMHLITAQYSLFTRPLHRRLTGTFLAILHFAGPEQQLHLLTEMLHFLKRSPELVDSFRSLSAHIILPEDVPYLRCEKLKLLAFLADESTIRILLSELKVLTRLAPSSAASILPEITTMVPSRLQEFRLILRSLLLRGHCTRSVEVFKSKEDALLSAQDIGLMLSRHPHLFKSHYTATSLRRLCPTLLCRADVLEVMYPIDVVMLGLECPEVWKHIDYSVFEKKVEAALENLPVYELDFLGFKIDHYSLKQS